MNQVTDSRFIFLGTESISFFPFFSLKVTGLHYKDSLMKDDIFSAENAFFRFSISHLLKGKIIFDTLLLDKVNVFYRSLDSSASEKLSLNSFAFISMFDHIILKNVAMFFQNSYFSKTLIIKSWNLDRDRLNHFLHIKGNFLFDSHVFSMEGCLDSHAHSVLYIYGGALNGSIKLFPQSQSEGLRFLGDLRLDPRFLFPDFLNKLRIRFEGMISAQKGEFYSLDLVSDQLKKPFFSLKGLWDFEKAQNVKIFADFPQTLISQTFYYFFAHSISALKEIKRFKFLGIVNGSWFHIMDMHDVQLNLETMHNGLLSILGDVRKAGKLSLNASFSQTGVKIGDGHIEALFSEDYHLNSFLLDRAFWKSDKSNFFPYVFWDNHIFEVILRGTSFDIQEFIGFTKLLDMQSIKNGKSLNGKLEAHLDSLYLDEMGLGSLDLRMTKRDSSFKAFFDIAGNQMTFDADPRSIASLMKMPHVVLYDKTKRAVAEVSLVGSINGKGSDWRVTRKNVKGSIGLLMHQSRSSFFDSTHFFKEIFPDGFPSCAIAHVTLQDGSVNLQNLKAVISSPLASAVMFGTGTVDLNQGQLNLKFFKRFRVLGSMTTLGYGIQGDLLKPQVRILPKVIPTVADNLLNIFLGFGFLESRLLDIVREKCNVAE